MIDELLLRLHAVATLAMTGVIWTMQRVHYPLFDLADRGSFPLFEKRHAAATGGIVIPLMLVEAATAGFLLWRPQELFSRPSALIGALLLLGIWISTFAIQVPCHRILARGFDEGAHRRLVRTNWIRTFLWTARTILVATAGLF